MTFDFDAGKYAIYVWPAFAATFVVLGYMVVDSLLRARKWKVEAERLQALKDAKKTGQ